jgi:hypothetical protein
MKNYKQVYLIAKDRSFKYEPIADVPSFSNEEEALAYWEYNKISINDCNFYNDPIVIIRKEISIVKIKDLN